MIMCVSNTTTQVAKGHRVTKAEQRIKTHKVAIESGHPFHYDAGGAYGFILSIRTG